MDVICCTYTCSHSYRPIEEENDDDLEAADNKGVTIMGPNLFGIDCFNPKVIEHQKDEPYLCACFFDVHRVTLAVNTFATFTNVFTLIILSLALSRTSSLDYMYTYHGDLTRLEINELTSALSQSIGVTLISIAFGIVAIVGLLQYNIWLTLPNLIWLVVGYILTVVINLKTTAIVSDYNYGMENIMFHFVVTCCFSIPNITFMIYELNNQFQLLPSPAIDVACANDLETSSCSNN